MRHKPDISRRDRQEEWEAICRACGRPCYLVVTKDLSFNTDPLEPPEHYSYWRHYPKRKA